MIGGIKEQWGWTQVLWFMVLMSAIGFGLLLKFFIRDLKLKFEGDGTYKDLTVKTENLTLQLPNTS